MFRLLYVLPFIIPALKAAWRLFRHPRVPLRLKAIPVLTALYVAHPFDLVPDFLLGFGQIDDLLIVTISLALFIALASLSVTKSRLGDMYRKTDSSNVVEGRFHYVESDD